MPPSPSLYKLPPIYRNLALRPPRRYYVASCNCRAAAHVHMFETSDVCCVKRIFSHGEMLTAVSSGNVVRGRRRLVSSSTEVDHIIDLKDTGAIPEREREGGGADGSSQSPPKRRGLADESRVDG
jgi:hypothetical protein